MNDMMKKLLDSKKQKGMLSDDEASAKMSVLKNLRGKSDASAADRLKGMKKVSVMSDSEEGLEQGLEKAKEIIDSHPTQIQEPEMEQEKMTHDLLNDLSSLSEEDVDDLLERLMAKKEELSRES